jgi:hypothetical protein
MFDAIDPELAPRLIIAIAGVAVALIALVVVLVFLKRRNSPLFIKGGRAREHRLMVLDAAAIDAKRRLVLIRRDDVEHLIMIGGPTDIVIETGIGETPAMATAKPAAIAPETTAAPLQITRSSHDVLPSARPVEPPEALAVQPAATPPLRKLAEAAPAEKPVSAMGAVLYNEEREPMGGLRPRAQAQTPQQPATRERADPIVSAESILDQARSRVLAQPATAASPAADEQARALAARQDAMKQEAARLEASRLEAARRAQAAQTSEPAVPVPKPVPLGQAIQSDFEKLLEAELKAGGLVDPSSGPRPVNAPAPQAAQQAAPARQISAAEQEIARQLAAAKRIDPSA